jgi:hypothetical protein
MHLLFFDIWKRGSGYNSKPTDTVFILVGSGILSKCMLKLLIYRGHNSIDSIVGIGILPTCIWQLLIYRGPSSSNPTVTILVGIGILLKCMF